MSLRRLGQESLDLFQLHRIDPGSPPDDQFGMLRDLLDEGKVQAVGLSEVSVEEIVAARKIVTDRDGAEPLQPHESQERRGPGVLRARGHRFHPVVSRSRPGTSRERADRSTRWRTERGVSVGQLSLAWLLRRSPVMLPIPGTSKVAPRGGELRGGHVSRSTTRRFAPSTRCAFSRTLRSVRPARFAVPASGLCPGVARERIGAKEDLGRAPRSARGVVAT